MTKQEHIEEHQLLHDNLDKLMAEYITHAGGLPSRTSLIDFMAWSHKQTVQPDHPPEK